MSPERDSRVDEGEGGGVDACAVVAAVGLQHLDEHVDLRPRVQLSADLEVQRMLFDRVLFCFGSFDRLGLNGGSSQLTARYTRSHLYPIAI